MSKRSNPSRSLPVFLIEVPDPTDFWPEGCLPQKVVFLNHLPCPRNLLQGIHGKIHFQPLFCQSQAHRRGVKQRHPAFRNRSLGFQFGL